MARKYSLEVVTATLRAHRGLLSMAADALRCSRSTLYRYMEEFPEVAAVVEEERERLVDMAEDALYYHLSEKAPWAIALVLKTLGKSRGYVEKGTETASPADMGRMIEASPEWAVIQSTLLQTLEPFPEARWAVVRALGGHESSNGHTPQS